MQKGVRRIIKKGLNQRKKIKFGQNFFFGLAGFAIICASFIFIWLATLKIPDFKSFDDRKIINSTKIYDRTGEVLLYDINQDIKRTSIPFVDMGANIKNATVAIEDSEFYNHQGVRVTSTIRAIVSNIFGIGIGGGGSTITQQLVKNTLLTKESGLAKYVRKVKEWVLAYKIEKTLDKEKILELYLNEVPYGGTVYGIEEASKTYFGKHAGELSIAEAAYLAGIPQSPTTLSPYGKHLDLLENRKNLVLFRMKELGFITEEEYHNSKEEKVAFLAQELKGIRAPHFVFFIKEYLENKYGADMVANGGLKVITTLDYKLQEKAEEIVKEGAIQNEKDWGGKNAALVAIDPKTGQILTMVGSRDYFDTDVDGNYNVATANRQPGSSFKPFIYATAFNKGFTPDTVVFDLPTEFQTTCDAYGKALPGRNQANCYMPSNYDNKTVGPISLRDALAQSRNIPAVKMFYLAGMRDSLRTAEELGITTLTDINRYGLTLVIGGGEVSLLDITSAYSVFANEGIRNQYTGILSVENVDGELLEEYNQNPKNVLPKNTALAVSDILSDNTARIPTFGANSVLKVGNKDVAVKTGTTNNNKDAWTVGYTPSIAVGVWSGNNDNTPMKKGGSAVAGPIWNKFINFALSTLPEEKFEEPYFDPNPENSKPVLRGSWIGNMSFFIDKISGGLATEHTPIETREEKIITDVHNILYWVNKNDITGESPNNPENDPQFNNWEIPVQNWWAQNSYKYPNITEASKPFFYDNVHGPQMGPKINLSSPNSLDTYNGNQKILVSVGVSGKYPIVKMEIFINDVYIGNSNSTNFSFIPNEIVNIRQINDIKVVAYDSIYNKGEVTSSFKIQ